MFAKFQCKVDPAKDLLLRDIIVIVNQCKVFAWGGCQPNANNFLNLAACQKECHCNQEGKFVDLYKINSICQAILTERESFVWT
jgi:hypothetical protein